MTETNAQHDGLHEADEGIDLMEIAVDFLSEWRLIGVCFLVTCVLGLIYILRLHPLYEAKATMLPHTSTSVDTTGLGSLFSRSGPGGIYIGLLGSRSVQDDVVDRTSLMDLYHLKSRQNARNLLQGMSSFSTGLDTLVNITVRNEDANVAAKIANAYLDALQNLNEQMELTQAVERRKFFEGQLVQERTELTAAEEDLANLQKRTGLVQPGTQTASDLGAIATARSDIDNRKVQLAALLESSTDQNPQVKTLRSQIAQLEANERALESSKGLSPAGAGVPAGEAPEMNLDYQRKQREVTFHETRMNALLTEYQSARLSEASSTSAFQVVDRAIPPERKSWPPRSIYMLFVIAFGLIAGAIGVVVKLVCRRIMTDPGHREQIEKLKNSFRLSR